jgi:predicted TIM-barrel fold metal-dependent hydrolase
MFEEAQRLGMTIAVHVGNANPSIVSLFSSEVGFGSGFFPFNLPMQGAFHATITSGLPMRFPGLKFAFLEAAAQWVPLIMQDLSRRGTRNSLRPLDTKVTAADRVAQLISNAPDLMEDFRLYVGLHTTDDVPYLLNYMGADSMVIGTDYGHADVNSDIDAIRLMQERGDIDKEIVDKILFHNPSKLYNIDIGAVVRS